MHHHVQYEHVITAFCVCFSVYVAWQYERRDIKRRKEHEIAQKELTELVYQASESVSDYRKLVARLCCFHQKACPSRGDAKILPQVYYLMELLIKSLEDKRLGGYAEDAANALRAELELWKRDKVSSKDVQALLESGDDAEEEPDALPSSASGKPRGRPKKQPPELTDAIS